MDIQKYSTKQKALVIAGAVCAAGLCYGLFLRFMPQPEEEKLIPVVRTITVSAKEGAMSTQYPGEIKGRYESKLAFQVGGKINSRPVDLGDKVTKGQILMTLDPKDVSEGAASSNAQLAAAEANQKLAEDNFNRYGTLYKQGAVSEATYDNYKTQLAAANAQLRQARAQASVSGNQLEYATLRSDADGVVTKVLAEVGQVTGAGANVITVVQDGEREVEINVPESALANLKPGDAAKINFWALNDTQAEGSIREISPVADSLTKTYKICVSIKDLPEDAKLGMTAKVSFASGTNNQALTLPAASIYQVDKEPCVWIVNANHKVELRKIVIDNYSGNDVVIKSGIKAGDIVVTAGLAKLTEGQEVRLEKNGDQK